MLPETPFGRVSSSHQHRRRSIDFPRISWAGPPPDTIYAGIAVMKTEDGSEAVAIAIRDTTYLLDFLEHKFTAKDCEHHHSAISDYIIEKLKSFSELHQEKFVGAALTKYLAEKCPTLCSQLWAEMDIVPLVLPEEKRVETDETGEDLGHSTGWETRQVDEQAESMGRKCVRLFGPENIPLLQVGLQGLVEVDTAFHVRLTVLEDFKKTVGHNTWASVLHYASDLKKRKVKIAFFSATPQGGGVALMRHALVRFSKSLGTDIKWYVPKPRPGVFRITKTNHNILQGVADPEDRLTPEGQKMMDDWIQDSAKRYWLCPGGPLRSPAEGGADVIIIDDPQMPGLIPIAKNAAPDRPVIFRSHIQVRSDLIATPGTPQADAWNWLWARIQQSDVFLSHPVQDFVPHNVPAEMVGYMPAATDWLDGLNKNMRDADIAYYGRVFNVACRNAGMPPIEYPNDQYIIQVARFDPSKGIFDVLESFEKFHKRLTAEFPDRRPPKLLICGHGSVDDPDGSMIYDAVVSHLEEMPHIRDLICVMRLRPSDQLLNTLLSKARVVLQLSTREGFEVKVSEAIHKGKPVIATRAGGIPLQVADKENGFLVDVGDTDAVAQHLLDLWTDDVLYSKMHRFALDNVCDEVSTVGNTLNWLYLASKLSQGEKVEPNGRWINDMAREDANRPYEEGESKLKRAVVVENMG
ncbi:hypothetical protein ASPZODRAFT_55049 [Penicilliopsis zonata CBS 506.65]|uniref:Uncharacterized protein n=1 Tax=Penicilliopsis zonata CBS 506.65 TaxID=1073090 RepID=A0A1L9SX02_9EURO|nr:hypothetical protein ASPZODRAFT_55049 [Penicilliopsis zonata CBS 506.65]OJJ51686.1 hypothetical protein ASPZODRAFT_55049 [Penicilliopsis zonata CBS 506.65]